MSDTFAVAISNSIYELMEVQASLALRKPSLMDLPNFRLQESQTIILPLENLSTQLQMSNSSSIRWSSKPGVNLQFYRTTRHPSRIPWPCRSSHHWPGPAEKRFKRDDDWNWIDVSDCEKNSAKLQKNLMVERDDTASAYIHTSCKRTTFGCLTSFMMEISRLICHYQKHHCVSQDILSICIPPPPPL